MPSRFYHRDKETGELREGHAPDERIIYGRAPGIICDSIPKYRHPVSGEIIESRRQLIETDKRCGTITTDRMLPADPSRRAQEAKQKKEQRMREMQEAVQMIDSGNAPLTPEIKAKCEARNEQLSKVLGIDAFNVAGRKDNEKGKRYGKK